MASTAPTIYRPPFLAGQPITWDPKSCGNHCVVIGNAPNCDTNPVSNSLFEGSITNQWTLNGTTSYIGGKVIQDAGGGLPGVRQNVTMDTGDYIAYYSFSYTGTGTWSGLFLITNGLGVSNLWTSTSQTTEAGAYEFTLSTGTDPRVLSIVMGTNEEVTCNYFIICPAEGFTVENNFCFQLPMYDIDTELLALSNEEVDLSQVFNYTVSTPYSQDTGSSLGACGSGITTNYKVLDASVLGLTLNNDGFHFIEIDSGSIDIDYGKNAADGTSKKLTYRSVDTVSNNESSTDFTEGNADDSLLYLSTNEFIAGDEPDLQVRLTSECDDTNERHKFDVTINGYSFYEAFASHTFTGQDDTFYRLTYKLNKCSVSSVDITDSDGYCIFEVASDGVIFDKIFKTGTLPVDKTITVTFKIGDSLSYPDANWNTGVLTEVQLWEMDDWTISLEDTSDVNIGTFTETHDSVDRTCGDEYNHNIQYCYDTFSLPPGNYQVRAVDGNNTDRQLISNQFSICSSLKDLVQITWTPTEIQCTGNEVIDYDNYSQTQQFWIKAELQDLTIEVENEFYRRSDGYWEKPWDYQYTIEILQIWPMPPYLRQTLSAATAGTFQINGVDYEKLNDEAISPEFNSVHESPVRILVHKVGNHIIRRQ